MKKLYAKQKIFKLVDHYPVLNENEETEYLIDQDLKLIGRTLHVSDPEGTHLFTIDKEIFQFLPRYKINFAQGKEVYLQKKFTFFGHSIEVRDQDQVWKVEGDFFGTEFQIYRDQEMVGEINKAFFSLSDTFEMIIYKEEDQDLIVAIMIAIDGILDDIQNRS